MDIYKQFIHRLRRLSLDKVYLILIENIAPKLKEYVRLITDVKFEDGSYHTLYGEMKKIVNSFMIYFSCTIDSVIKEADRFTNVIDKDELMELMANTISSHQTNQLEFGREYLPTTSLNEKQIYEEIELKYNTFMENLFQLKGEIEQLNHKSKIDHFANNHFQITVKNTSEIFHFTRDFMAMMLADRLNQIRVSLEEILRRIRNNIRRMQEECDSSISALLNQLYEKNKEHLTISRRDRSCSMECAEVSRSIEIIRNKLQNYDENGHRARLDEEAAFWERRLSEFDEVANMLTQLKAELDNVVKQEHTYDNMRSTELPGAKYTCWQTMGTNFKERKVYLEEKILEAAKALLTFFTCRGTDRPMYEDHIGKYYVDEFNHQVYIFDYSMGVYHVDCDGKFQEVLPYPELDCKYEFTFRTSLHSLFDITENEIKLRLVSEYRPKTIMFIKNRAYRKTDKDLYYYDETGRYIYEEGEKVYQCAPCTSRYKLTDDTLLTKASMDCGHSEKPNAGCRLDIKDLTDVEILPKTDAVDIKRTLDSETVKYLWECFGGLLPDALRDVAHNKPKNPIHYLAHRLLYHKYSRTRREVQKKTNDAEVYRSNIYRERKDKAISTSKAWKAKQVRRRKPEESDDAENMAVHEALAAQREFINSLNYYN